MSDDYNVVAKSLDTFYRDLTPTFQLNFSMPKLESQAKYLKIIISGDLDSPGSISPKKLCKAIYDEFRKCKSEFNDMEGMWSRVQKKIGFSRDLKVSPGVSVSDLTLTDQVSLGILVFKEVLEEFDSYPLESKLEPQSDGPGINDSIRDVLFAFKDVKKIALGWGAQSKKLPTSTNPSLTTSQLQNLENLQNQNWKFRRNDPKMQDIAVTTQFVEKRINQILMRYNDCLEDVYKKNPEWEEVKKEWTINENISLGKNEYNNPTKGSRVNRYA